VEAQPEDREREPEELPFSIADLAPFGSPDGKLRPQVS